MLPDRRRVSDEDRDRAASILSDAVATGRLSPEEHAERLDAAFAATTFSELVPLTDDLPVPAPLAQPVTRAVLSKIQRQGAWAVPQRSVVNAVFGVIQIDLRNARFPRREVAIQAGSFAGKVELYVPADAEVVDYGSALLGKRSAPEPAPGQAGGPIIHVHGRSVLGKLKIVR